GPQGRLLPHRAGAGPQRGEHDGRLHRAVAGAQNVRRDRNVLRCSARSAGARCAAGLNPRGDHHLLCRSGPTDGSLAVTCPPPHLDDRMSETGWRPWLPEAIAALMVLAIGFTEALL